MGSGLEGLEGGEQAGQQPGIAGARQPVQRIVSRHDRERPALADGRFDVRAVAGWPRTVKIPGNTAT